MSRDLSENAIRLYQKRYLAPGENIDGLFRRVANGNEDFIRLMEESKFLPNSPTLFNAGLSNGCTLSACFVFDVDDTMLGGHRSIVETRGKAIAVAKAGGGVGYYFGNLRGKGSPISSVHRIACGPVAVLRDYHAISHLVTQGGKRQLAQMGVLPASHPDAREFIHCKDADPQGLSSFNISLSWADSEIALSQGSPEYASLWQEQVASAWAHGCPGMLFSDAINRGCPNPHLGRINATNPCGETPNRSDEPCNLGSLNLWRFVDLKTRAIRWGELEDAVRIATRFLDDILDRNIFPHPAITDAALLTRKLGLGVMGWADTLALLGIHYDTEEALDLAGKAMGLIASVSLEESILLAKGKGPYRGYSDRTQGPEARNETRTSIAPTGSISILADASSSIEPHYALEWERTTGEGMKFTERIPVWAHLDGFVPKTAQEIDWRWHVRHQAAFQKHTDLGVSKTINMPNSATKEDVSSAYRMMHELECKGGTIFRDGCRNEQVLVAKKTTNVFTIGLQGDLPKKRKMPATRKSLTHKFRVNGTRCFVTVGLFEDGQPGEIFMRVARGGSALNGVFDSWAIAFSIALQGGVPLDVLCRHQSGISFEPAGLTDNRDIPTCTSIPDYIARWLRSQFLAKDKATQKPSTDGGSGAFCPECGNEAIYAAGCLTCPNKECGWTRCG